MKKVAILLVFLSHIFVTDLQANVVAPDTLSVNPITDSIVTFAKSFLGTKYKYGSASPKSGFDCSGFTWYVFNHFGYAVPRSAKEYKNAGKEVSISAARKGDIVVFRGTHPNDKSAGHVGIVISNEGEPLQFIHASSSKNHKGVVITEYLKSNYPKRFIKVIRVIN